MTRSKKVSPSNLEVVVRGVDQLGIALIRFRRQEGWTQDQAGERSGVKQTVISSVESGTIGTRVGTLFKILAALDLEVVVRKRRKTTHWPERNS